MSNLSNPTVLDLRRINRQRILQMVYFTNNHGITRPQLSANSGLSAGTIANVVSELLAENILVEQGMQESQGGRPRTILSVNPTFGYFVGMDIGETHLCLELFDLTFQKLNTIVEPVQEAGQTQPAHMVEVMVAGLNQLLEQAGLSQEQVIGVGVGVPGIVERLDKGDAVVLAPAWGWERVPLLSLLKARLNIPIFIENGAKAMTQAESWFKVGQHIESLVALLVGTGVGGGIIQQGKLYRGTTNSAGELGHTIIEFGGRPCRCGSRGCLEAYVGAPGIIARLKEAAPDHSSLSQPTEQKIIKALVEAAQAEDSVAVKNLSDTAQYIGAAIVNIVNIFNPQLIVLGGWVGVRIGDFILPEVKKVVNSYALKPALRDLQILTTRFGQDAISLGAATLPLGEFLANSAQWSRSDPKLTKVS